jgi:UPF0716 family protein affecting phage T7 exclusion
VRRLTGETFLLVLIGVPVLEVFVFIEVGRTIGWLLTMPFPQASSPAR